MKKLRKYKFSTIELANEYINALSQENSAILLNSFPAAQTIEIAVNPDFNKDLPVSLENTPMLYSNVDFENQYLVDVVWQNEINSQWSEFEVFPHNTLWRNRIFNELSEFEKDSAMAEYNLYLNNKKSTELQGQLLLENDFFILNNYVLAWHFNKNGNVLTGNSFSPDAKSNAAIMVYTIHETCNVNYNIKLETDNQEDTLKVVILEKQDDETPKEVLFETNTTEIKNGVISLKRGNVIAFEYVKNSYNEDNKVTFTLGY